MNGRLACRRVWVLKKHGVVLHVFCTSPGYLVVTHLFFLRFRVSSFSGFFVFGFLRFRAKEAVNFCSGTRQDFRSGLVSPQ